MSIESVMPSNHLMLCCPPSLLALNLSQHPGLFQWVSSSHQVENWWEQQGDAPTHLLEGPKSKCRQQQMLARMRSNRNSRSWLVGVQSATATLEDSLAASYEAKHTLTIWSSNHASWYLTKWVQNICLPKTLPMHVYSSFVHNCQNLEATMISFRR